jgi:hypothetical protein
MKKLISGLAVILISVPVFAITRKPLATIPGPQGQVGNVGPAVAARDGILAIANNYPSPHVDLYAIPNWTQVIATLTPSGSEIEIISVAIQNNYVAVGIVSILNQQGSVYIFPKPKSGWASEFQTAVLTPTNSLEGDWFGWQVSAWGNTLLVGAAGTDLEGGSAYLYVEPEGGWVNATQTTQFRFSTVQHYFGIGVSLSGTVGSGGTLVVVEAEDESESGVCVAGCVVADIYVEPEGGWPSTMTQTAELWAQPGEIGYEGYVSGTVAAEKSTIVIDTPDNEQGSPIYIYIEPKGGWVDTSSPNFTANVPANNTALGRGGITLTQSAQVLVTGVGHSYKKNQWDLAYLWHANKDFGSSPIVLSAVGYTTTLQGATVTTDYAFSWDGWGNVFVFDGE